MEWNSFCDIELDIPPIEIQRKYVAIYEGLLANLRSYEKGLDDLKLVCDGYIEDLRRKYPCKEIGEYLQETNEKNDGTITLYRGVDVNMMFTEPKRVADDKSSGKVVHNNEIAFNKVMKANCTKLPIALRKGDDCVISGSYTVFKVNQNFILPDYLMMWLSRTETQRWAGFVSYGTTRDIFSFDNLCTLKIPMPSLEVQNDIVAIYNSLKKRNDYVKILNKRVSSICPILIRGSIIEAQGGQ
jgi:type I restriction enzyme S subunit